MKFSGNKIRSDLKELMFSDRPHGLLFNQEDSNQSEKCLHETYGIQTPESSGNLSDKSSRDAGNNGEKSSQRSAGFIKLYYAILKKFCRSKLGSCDKRS